MAATVSTAGFEYGLRISPTARLRIEDTRTVVVLRGEWDVSTRGALFHVLAQAIESGPGDVVIDLADAGFIDTAAVRVMISARKLLIGGGRRLSFRSPTRLAGRVLDAFGLTDLIEGQARL